MARLGLGKLCKCGCVVDMAAPDGSYADRSSLAVGQPDMDGKEMGADRLETVGGELDLEGHGKGLLVLRRTSHGSTRVRPSYIAQYSTPRHDEREGRERMTGVGETCPKAVAVGR